MDMIHYYITSEMLNIFRESRDEKGVGRARVGILVRGLSLETSLNGLGSSSRRVFFVFPSTLPVLHIGELVIHRVRNAPKQSYRVGRHVEVRGWPVPSCSPRHTGPYAGLSVRYCGLFVVNVHRFLFENREDADCRTVVVVDDVLCVCYAFNISNVVQDVVHFFSRNFDNG